MKRPVKTSNILERIAARIRQLLEGITPVDFFSQRWLKPRGQFRKNPLLDQIVLNPAFSHRDQEMVNRHVFTLLRFLSSAGRIVATGTLAGSRGIPF